MQSPQIQIGNKSAGHVGICCLLRYRNYNPHQIFWLLPKVASPSQVLSEDHDTSICIPFNGYCGRPCKKEVCYLVASAECIL